MVFACVEKAVVLLKENELVRWNFPNMYDKNNIMYVVFQDPKNIFWTSSQLYISYNFR